MVCYIVPLAATILGAARRRSLKKTDAHGLWLNIMLLGGALFGLIDHAWNGELFMLGPNMMADLALGFTITAGIFAGWGAIVYKNHLEDGFRLLTRRTGILR